MSAPKRSFSVVATVCLVALMAAAWGPISVGAASASASARSNSKTGATATATASRPGSPPSSSSSSTTVTATADSNEVLPFSQSPLRAKVPTDWSARDVEFWMNNTIGYPEYAPYVRAHVIDGITLLAMEPADFESFLPIEHALHVMKLTAHLRMLKGLYGCSDPSGSGGGGTTAAGAAVAADFWGYMKLHSLRTWVWGTTALFFPRWAMAGAYLFDRDTFVAMVGRPMTAAEVEGAVLAAADGVDASAAAAGSDFHAELAGAGSKKAKMVVPSVVVSKPRAAVYWLCFLVAPDLYMAYEAARLVPSNYILMPCVVAHFLAQAFSEASLLITIYAGTAFKPSTSLLSRVWLIFSYTLFAPVLGLVVGLIFPVFLQYITVTVIIAHSFLMILGIVILVMRDGLSAATTGPEDPRFAAAEEAAGPHKAKEEDTTAAATRSHSSSDGSISNGTDKTAAGEAKSNKDGAAADSKNNEEID